jgi:hypothetical protein
MSGELSPYEVLGIIIHQRSSELFISTFDGQIGATLHPLLDELALERNTWIPESLLAIGEVRIGSNKCIPVSYPIYSRFSSKVPDIRSNQIQSTDSYQIHYDKLLHSYPVHITLNTAYFLHLVYLPFQYIGYAYFRLWLLIR